MQNNRHWIVSIDLSDEQMAKAIVLHPYSGKTREYTRVYVEYEIVSSEGARDEAIGELLTEIRDTFDTVGIDS